MGYFGNIRNDNLIYSASVTSESE